MSIRLQDIRSKLNEDNMSDLYDLTDIKITYDTKLGSREFLSSTLNLPRLITRIWVNKLLGEKPYVAINEEKVDLDLTPAVSPLLAYGTVIYVPFLNSLGEFKYYTLKKQDCKVLFEEDEVLKYLEFEIAKDKLVNGNIQVEYITYKYTFENNICLHSRYSKDTVYYDNVKISDFMLPFVYRLTLNADNIGTPVWWNAKDSIIDTYYTYSEMMFNIEIQRPINAIATNLTLSALEEEQIRMATTRQFTYVPRDIDTGTPDWQTFGGDFNPAPYLKLIDTNLHIISLNSYLGSKYLSFDKATNVAKTAREVTYSQNDLYISVALVQQTLEQLLQQLLKRYALLKLNNANADIKISFEDGVFESPAEMRQQMSLDVNAGLISREFYISKIYKNEDIDLVMPNTSTNVFVEEVYVDETAT